MNNITITKIISQIENKKVLVIGDFYLDEYIHCSPKSLSPEVPVPRIVFNSKEHMPGAAANIAVGFSDLGATVYACGILGDDKYGEILVNKLLEKRIITNGLLRGGNRITGVFSRIIGDFELSLKHHIVRIDYENKTPINDFAQSKLLNFIRATIPEIDLIFIADYDENVPSLGVVNETTLKLCIEYGNKNKKPIFGISRRNINLLNGLDGIILNNQEMEKFVNFKLINNDDITQALPILRNKLNIKTVAVTLGENGAVLFENNKTCFMKSLAKNVVDVCGAGDSFSIAFALTKTIGLELKDCIEFAMMASAIAVSKVGTSTASKGEIINFNNISSSFKIITYNKLLELISSLKEKGKKIVFTNGCFDMITSGQIELLDFAKKKGDILIVGLNSDRSIEINRGPGRPILNEKERTKILSAFESVDYVTVYDELTPIKLISELKPDVLIKGGNYSIDQVVGRDIVSSYNGEVIMFPYVGKTTDQVMNTINATKNNKIE